MPRHSPLAALLQRYGISGVNSFRPLDEGLLNRAFAVLTDTGPLFLKHYLEQSPQTIRTQHAATRALADAGLPAVPPLADLSGRTLVRHHGNLFALYPWVDGEHCPGPRMSPARCRELGALLARFHSALIGILGPVEQPIFQTTPSPEEAEAHALRLLDLCRTRPRREGIDELAEFRLLERIGLIHDHVTRRPPDTGVLSVGHVHGDFHGLNVLHGPEGDVRAVVDWDRLSVRPYGEELVRSALIIYVDRDDGTLDLDRAREYVGGYLDQRPWTAAEMETAVHRLWWERLTDFWMLSWRYERRDPRADEQFPAASALIVWWTHHYDKVLDAFVH